MIRVCALICTLLIPAIAFPQNQSPDPYAALQDDLLDRLVGKWNVAGTTHNTPTAQTRRTRRSVFQQRAFTSNPASRSACSIESMRR
jgi:hypothetical protein